MQNRAHRGYQLGDYSVPTTLIPKSPRRHLRRHETLHHVGEPFNSLFVVRLGHLKSLTLSEGGFVQVTEFLMANDVTGLDGIDTGHHQTAVIALDDVEVFELHYAQCEQWSRASAIFQRRMARLLAFRAERSREHMFMLGTMHADQRLATFLLDLSERYCRLGYSRSKFVLRMTRKEMASYLGLKLETVSRALSQLQQRGLVQLEGKSIALLDFPALWGLSGTSPNRQDPVIDPILNRDGELQIAR